MCIVVLHYFILGVVHGDTVTFGTANAILTGAARWTGRTLDTVLTIVTCITILAMRTRFSRLSVFSITSRLARSTGHANVAGFAFVT